MANLKMKMKWCAIKKAAEDIKFSVNISVYEADGFLQSKYIIN